MEKVYVNSKGWKIVILICIIGQSWISSLYAQTYNIDLIDLEEYNVELYTASDYPNDPVNILVPPANDDLCNAVPLTVDQSCTGYIYTTVDATSEGIPEANAGFGCAQSNPYSVWFSFVAPAGGAVDIVTDFIFDETTVGFERVLYSTGMSFDCSDYTDIMQIDCTFDCYDYMLSATGLTPGDTYYIRIRPVFNCPSFIPSSSSSSPLEFCLEIIDTCPCPTFSLGVSPEVNSNITDTFIEYYDETGSPTEYSIDYDITAEAAGFVDQIAEPFPPFGQFPIIIPMSAAPGVYNATVVLTNICCSSAPIPFTITIIPPPVNDNLCNDIPLFINAGCVGFPYTTIGATNEDFEYGYEETVWFSFIAPLSGEIEIITDADQFGYLERVLYEEGLGFDCGTGTQLLFVDKNDDCAFFQSLTASGLTPGQNYFVRIQPAICAGFVEFVSSPGDFCIQANDACPCPSIVLSDNPEACSNESTVYLIYTSTTESPTEYSIDYDVVAESEGFADQNSIPIPSPGPDVIDLIVPPSPAGGIYNATIYVTNGCCNSLAEPFTVTINEAPGSPLISGGGTICEGESIDIFFTIPGGTSPFYVEYMDSFAGNFEALGYISGTPISVSPSSSTNYSIFRVTDDNGCEVLGGMDVASVTVNSSPGGSMLNGGATICEGESTDLYFSIPGGTPPFIVEYSDGMNTFPVINYFSDDPISVNPIVNTDYFPVSVTDSNGCEAGLDGFVSITVNPSPGATMLYGGGTICEGESALIYFSIPGGTPPFIVEYSDGMNIFPVINYFSDDPIFVIPIGNTDYTPVSVTDANGCNGGLDGLVSFLVNDSPNSIIFSGSSTICEGESTDLFLSVEGGIAPYTVKYWDGMNYIQVSDYYNNDPISVSPTMSTDYFIGSVIDANGCEGGFEVCVSVTVNDTPGSTLLYGDNTICEGESANIYFSIPGGTAPFTVEYSDGSSFFIVSNYQSDEPILVSPIIGTVYTPFNVTDANGCVGTLNGFSLILVHESTGISTLEGGGSICQGESAQIFFSIPGGTAPYTVEYTDGVDFFQVPNYYSGDPIYVSPIIDTDYFPVHVYDSNECSGSLNGFVSVIVNETPGGTMLYGGATICEGESTDIFFFIPGGTPPYIVEYTDGMNIFQLVNYSSDEPISISPNTNTDYSPVSVTDANDCVGGLDGFVSVIVNDSPGATMFYGGAIICEGESTDIFFSIPGGTPPYIVEYTDGMNIFQVLNYTSDHPISISPIINTDYSPISVTDVNGCFGGLDGFVSVLVNDSPGVTMLYGGATLCEGESTDIFFSIPGGTPPYTVEYTDGMNLFQVFNYKSDDPIPVSPLVNTDYSPVSVIDVNGCFGGLDGFVSVLVNDSPGNSTLYGDNTICGGETTYIFFSILGGSAPYTVEYSDGMDVFQVINYLSDDLIPVSPTMDTEYFAISVIDANDCIGTQEGIVSVIVNESPGSSLFYGSSTICVGESTNLYFSIPGGTPPFTVEYSNGGDNFIINNYLSDEPIIVSPSENTIYSPINITDQNGCMSELNGIVNISVNDSPSNTILVGDGTICQGESIDIYFSILGGTAPYIVTYSDGSQFFTIEDYYSDELLSVNPNMSTVYTPFMVVDANGCTGNLSGFAIILVTEGPEMAYLHGGGSICDAGSIDIFFSITGGVAPYRVEYTDGVDIVIVDDYYSEDAITVNPMMSTTYYPLSVTDAEGCTGDISGEAIVELGGNLGIATLSGGTMICLGSSTNLFFSIEGGIGPYTIEFSDGTENFQVLNYGSNDPILISPEVDTDYFPVSVTDTNGCEAALDGFVSITVSPIAGPGNAVLKGGGIICKGDEIEIYFTIPGGASPFVIEYSDGSDIFLVSNYLNEDPILVNPLVSTEYIPISLTDANGCEGNLSGTVDIIVNDTPENASLNGGGSICVGENIDIFFSIFGGTPPFEVQYSDGTDVFQVINYFSDEPITVNPLETTEYVPVSVTDMNGCEAVIENFDTELYVTSKVLVGSAIVIVNENPSYSSLNGGGEICNGETTSIYFAIEGGTGPYTVEYTDGLDVFKLIGYINEEPIYVNPTINTTYTPLSVSDTNGCTGGLDGFVNVIVNDGPESLSISGDNSICMGESTDIFISVLGGTPPYAVEYSDGNEIIQTINYYSDNPLTVSPLVTTEYTLISLTDEKGCQLIVDNLNRTSHSGLSKILPYAITIIVNEGPASTIIRGGGIVCEGSSVEIYFEIQGGTPPYMIEYTDGENDFFINNYENEVPIIVNPLEDTDYSPLSILDSNGCEGMPEGIVSVIINEGLGMSIFDGGGDLCLGETTELIFIIPGGTGPFTIEYSDGESTYLVSEYYSEDPIFVSPISDTEYSPISIKDINGCVGSVEGIVNIEVLEGPEDALFQGGGVICEGEKSELFFSIFGGLGPFVVEFTDGMDIITVSDYKSNEPILVFPSVSTEYRPVQATDANGCSVELFGSVRVTLIEKLQSSSLDGFGSICEGESSDLYVNIIGGVAPYSIVLNDGDTDIIINNYYKGPINLSPESTTEYTLIKVSDACTESFIVSGSSVINVNNGPESASFVGGASICKGESVDLFVNIMGGVPPYTVVYNNGEEDLLISEYNGGPITLTPGDTTQYTLISIRDECYTIENLSSTANIYVRELPTIDFITQNCSNDLLSYSVELNSNGDILTSSAGTIVDNGFQMYRIIDIPAGVDLSLTSEFSDPICESSLILKAPICACPNINPAVSEGDKEICENESIPILTVLVESGETVDWYESPFGGVPVIIGSSSILPAGAGVYYAETRNEVNNCVSGIRTSVELKIFTNPEPMVTGDASLCFGQSNALLNGGANWTEYLWSTEEITEQILVSESGSYQLSVTDQNGCMGIAEFFVMSLSPPEPNIVGTFEICSESSSILELDESFDSYLWNDGSANKSIQVSESGLYSVTVTDENGCTGNSTVEVTLTEGSVFESNFLTNKRICLGDTLHFIDISDISANIQSYLWAFGDGMFSTERDPVHLYTMEGIYDVHLQAVDNSCVNISETKQVEVAICRREIFDESNFSSINIYPNPSSGYINLNIVLLDNMDILIQLYTVDGMILNSSFFHGKTINENYEILNSGIYFIKMTTPYHTKTKKIVVNK